MSGVGGIGGCGSGTSPANMAAMRANMDPAKMAERMQGKLDEKLSEAGVSEETREALQADLVAAFEAHMSSGSKPDPTAMKETISSVFAQHGLNAEDFMPQDPPGMGGRGGRGAIGGGGGKGDTQSMSGALSDIAGAALSVPFGPTVDLG